ncbi:MAG: MerR family transcriptional regulator [Bdellovibrionaceae bacterium]|nr:MerR family transcriptional regulator [Pseudobdellovibrionaceae bacterium]
MIDSATQTKQPQMKEFSAEAHSEAHPETAAPVASRVRRVFDELPGTNEGKAALMEFELSDLDFVEEQQTFDFGAEFHDAPPTAAMLPKTELPVSDENDEDQAVFLGDDDTQLDFEEAARAIAAEEAAERLAAANTAIMDAEPALILNETTLPRLKVSTDAELLAAIRAIPTKMAFKIGEVAEMVGVKQYVLRYWESEFDALKPRKSKNGQRVYARRDVETAMMIRKLLYTDRFSIEGARSALRQLKSQVREEKQWNQVLSNQERVREGLRSLVSEIRRFREILA